MKTTEERLDEIAQGAAVLTIPQIAQALGQSNKWADASIRNRLARGSFPIRGRKLGKVWVFSIKQVAEWIDGDEPEAEPLPPALPVEARKARSSDKAVRTGRPTNAMRAERLKRMGMAFAVQLEHALDDWWRDHQRAEAAELRAAADEALAKAGVTTLANWQKGPRGPRI
ncbi:hypothetical protein KDW61_21170 [Burkholderia cenocepacia]|uniref:hypothetical protein n=1 Tax=Burkholderia cenocepacia TaxID=95486 RepID=UPI001B910CDF|nr:hypothetical protein [Burkholderia cenocepacia]MBR8211176.1 hypothetical protein [Burkholderia cenocepacia]